MSMEEPTLRPGLSLPAPRTVPAGRRTGPPRQEPPRQEPPAEEFVEELADELVEETANVRPYTVTGGRTHPSSAAVPIESLVECLGEPGPEHTAESRRILDLTARQYLSVAELSAHLHLPVGVVRVLACDLADEGLVRLHGLTLAGPETAPATTLSVLESVLDGISAL
jgi:hypothetical protein